MEEVHRGGYLRIAFQSFPRLLHLFGVMYIINKDNCFFMNVRQQHFDVTQSGFLSMVRINKCEIQLLWKMFGECIVDISFHELDVVQVQRLPRPFGNFSDGRASFKRSYPIGGICRGKVSGGYPERCA